jgi:hypothetical protein
MGAVARVSNKLSGHSPSIRGGIKVTRSRAMWAEISTYAAVSSYLIMDTTAWIFDVPNEASKVLTRMLFSLGMARCTRQPVGTS